MAVSPPKPVTQIRDKCMAVSSPKPYCHTNKALHLSLIFEFFCHSRVFGLIFLQLDCITYLDMLFFVI